MVGEHGPLTGEATITGECGRLQGGDEGDLVGRPANALGEVTVGDVDVTRGVGYVQDGGDPWSLLSVVPPSSALAPSNLLSQEPNTEVRCSAFTDGVDRPVTTLSSRVETLVNVELGRVLGRLCFLSGCVDSRISLGDGVETFDGLRFLDVDWSFLASCLLNSSKAPQAAIASGDAGLSTGTLSRGRLHRMATMLGAAALKPL